jgi:hypothetical protein
MIILQLLGCYYCFFDLSSFELPPALAGARGIQAGSVVDGFSQKRKTFWLKPI